MKAAPLTLTLKTKKRRAKHRLEVFIASECRIAKI